MWFDRFRVHTAEAWVASAADFVAGDAIARKEFGEQACSRAMHNIGDEAKLRAAQSLPIDQFLERV